VAELVFFFASRRCSSKARVNVKAALTIKPTVTELPTRKRGAYLVSYVIRAIQALKAYLVINETDQRLPLVIFAKDSEQEIHLRNRVGRS